MKCMIQALVIAIVFVAVAGDGVSDQNLTGKMEYCVSSDVLKQACTCNDLGSVFRVTCACNDRKGLYISGTEAKAFPIAMTELIVMDCEGSEIVSIGKDMNDRLPSLETMTFTNLTSLTFGKDSLHLMSHINIIIDSVQNLTLKAKAITFKPLHEKVSATLQLTDVSFAILTKDAIMTDYKELEEAKQFPTLGFTANNVQVLCHCEEIDWLMPSDKKTNMETTKDAMMNSLTCIKGDMRHNVEECAKKSSSSTRLTTVLISVFMMPLLSLLLFL